MIFPPGGVSGSPSVTAVSLPLCAATVLVSGLLVRMWAVPLPSSILCAAEEGISEGRNPGAESAFAAQGPRERGAHPEAREPQPGSRGRAGSRVRPLPPWDGAGWCIVVQSPPQPLLTRPQAGDRLSPGGHGARALPQATGATGALGRRPPAPAFRPSPPGGAVPAPLWGQPDSALLPPCLLRLASPQAPAWFLFPAPD